METFLDKLAKKILEEHDSPDKACIVFPGRRAGVFFKKSLKSHANKTLLTPDIFSMQDFVLKYTGLYLADAVALSFELYEVHKHLKGKEAESFGEFLKYSSTIIHDFNEIDMHLIDPEKAFSVVSDYTEMTTWDLETSGGSAFQKKYVDFFKSLASYHKLFTERLLDRGMAYQGLAFKRMAAIDFKNTDHFDRIYFAGFNALTPAEQKIADNLIQDGLGAVIWDIDPYYYNDPHHEAGKSLRRLRKIWPQFKDFSSNSYKDQHKRIQVLGAPGRVAQAKAAGQLLKDFKEQDEVALVLADEALLEPLINSIPDNISTFNITMGLPLKNTMLFSLFSALFTLHTAPYGLGKNQKTESQLMYYFKDVLRVLSHPVIIKMFEMNYEGFSRSEKAPALVIQKADKSFYSLEDLETLHKDIGVKDFRKFHFLWDDWNQSPHKAISSFIDLLDALKPIADRDMEQDGDVMLSEYIFRFSSVLQQISTLHEEYTAVSEIEIFRRLFQQLASREEVSFRGEPLKGVQVMGMLETRLLDFKNVILLSANEEFIPGNTDEVSFIPFEVRLHFNLPLKTDRSSVYAYHFYHLLQRAENIHLVYNNHPDGVSSNELSRFVKQLQFELPEYNDNVRLKEAVVTSKTELVGDDEIRIEKSASLMQELKLKAKKGFSATSLNKYRQCSLKFYFEEILGIQQHEEVEETIEARTLGNAVHLTLEKLYKELGEGKDISSAAVEQMQKKMPQTLSQTFSEEYGANSFSSGKNLLVYELAKHWLDRFFDAESGWALLSHKEQNAYRFIKTEEYIKITRDLQLPDKTSVTFKGHIDRVDQKNSEIRIIDYKTGKVTPNKLRLHSVDDFKGNGDKKEAFQLLFYQWLFMQQHPEKQEAISPGILSFPALKAGVMPLNTSGSTHDLINDFEDYLFEMVGEIFDPEKAFTKTEDRLNCLFCDFKSVCNRYS